MLDRDRKGVHLDNLSPALLRLHKALLDAERLSYERIHGRIPSNGEFLQLVLGNSWFAWLRPLSRQISALDELSESDAVSDGEVFRELLKSIQTLLTPAEEGEGFARQYYEALQLSPDVVLAHASVKALLSQSISSKR